MNRFAIEDEENTLMESVYEFIFSCRYNVMYGCGCSPYYVGMNLKVYKDQQVRYAISALVYKGFIESYFFEGKTYYRAIK